MEARLLLAIFDSVYLFTLAAWVGSILFFSFGIAPIIFKVLDPTSAARFVRVLFPRYYAWGVVSSAIALPAYLGVPLAFTEYRGWWVAVQSLLIIASILIFLYCGNTLTPQINAARDAGPSEELRFQKLHKRSVGLNAIVLLLGIVLLVTQATRRSPRTNGILEMTPQERAVYDGQTLDYIKAKFANETTVDGPQATPGSISFDGPARKEVDEIVAAKQAEARKRKDRQDATEASKTPRP